MRDGYEKETFVQIAVALERLQQRVRAVRELPKEELLDLLRLRAERSCARANALVQRVEQLRQLIEVRRRRLEQLRARMHQIRGGAKPH
jgi:hypothetical protein